MAFGDTTQYSTAIGKEITCHDADGQPLDLTGATITGTLTPISGAPARAIAGTLSLDPDESHVILWTIHANDVAQAGTFDVQLCALLPGGKKLYSFPARWIVMPTTIVP